MIKRTNSGKKELYIWLLLDLLISFMLGIFAPVDIYYANQDEYWFSLWQMLSACFLVFLFSFVILSLLSWALNRCRVSPFIHLSLFAILLFFYIQGNYIPRNYGILNGEEIIWDQYPGYAWASIINLIVWVVLFALICIKFRNKIPAIIKTGCFVLLGIQLITIGTLVIQNTTKDADRNNKVVTTKGQFDFSCDNNIVIFLLDKFGAQDFQDLLVEDYEKYTSVFQDFTFYPDCLGAYPSTKCSIPYILTGKWYENGEPFADYIQNAFNNNNVYSTLRDNDYRIFAYTSDAFLSKEDGFYENVETGQYIINDIASFLTTLYRLVAFNYMPHQAKYCFVIDSNAFLPLRKLQSLYDPYSEEVLSFNEQYNQNGITISAKGNVFKFYHLEGVHDPFTFDEDLHTKPGCTRLDEAKGNITLLKKILHDFDLQGIYDTSTIIIMADHGSEDYYQNPLFMIKNQKERHPFFVSDEEMSWEYLSQIWMTLAKGGTIDKSFFSMQGPNREQRRFLYYSWDDAWDRYYMPGMEEFYCKGSAQDPDNLIPTGQGFYANNEDHSYNMGSILDFSNERSGYMYCLYGIAYDDMICAGRVMQKAGLQFQLPERESQNILCSISTNEHSGVGVFSLFANGNLVAEYTYYPSSSYHIVIPHEFIDEDRTLLLEFDQTSGEDNAYAKTTNTGFLIDNMKLINTSYAFQIEDQMKDYHYNIGTEIRFGEKNNTGNNYILGGFSQTEENGTWMTGRISKLKCSIDPSLVHDGLELALNYIPFGDKQRITIIVNGQIVEEYSTTNAEIKTISLSKNIIDTKDGIIQISIKHPDAHSPKSLGINEDERELSLFLKSICIR